MVSHHVVGVPTTALGMISGIYLGISGSSTLVYNQRVTSNSQRVTNRNLEGAFGGTQE